MGSTAARGTMKLGALASARGWAGEACRRHADSLRAAVPDIGIACVLAVLAFVATLIAYDQLVPAISHYSTWDYWFEGDPARIVFLALDRHSLHHHSTSHHPLFSLAIFPPVTAFRALGLSPVLAIGATLALCSAVWAGLANATLRLMGLKRLDAAVFTALMAATSGVVFFFAVPETFSFGALSLLVVIAASAAIERNGGVAPPWLYVAVGVFAMSMTTTNWAAALGMMVVFLPFREAVWRGWTSLWVVLAIWAVQKIAFPEADNFLNIFRGSEVDYLFNPESVSMLAKLVVFFFHSIVMPDIGDAYGYRLSVQRALPGAGGPLAMLGVLLWTALLALGIWSLALLRRARGGLKGNKTILVLMLTLGGQLAVAIGFGIETFLYSAHFAPLLVMSAALSALTPMRKFAVPLAAVLAVVAGVNNVQKLWDAADRIATRYEHEQRFAAAMADLADPSQLIVCGASALAGMGEQGMSRQSLAVAEPWDVASPVDPDTCVYEFAPGDLPSLTGWRLWYEDWSIGEIEAAAERGARYFATQYEYGIAQRPDLFEALDARYRSILRTPEMAIYDLQAEPGP